MSSRRYIKRVWRVPKDRGPAEYLAALIVKALVKHGWPARSQIGPSRQDFAILYDKSHRLPPDFAEAVDIAARITARTYRIDIEQHGGAFRFNRPYRVNANGQFVELSE